MALTTYKLAPWINSDPGTFAARNERDHDDVIHLRYEHRGQPDYSTDELRIRPLHSTNNPRLPTRSDPIFVEVIEGVRWWVSKKAAAHIKYAR